MKQDAEGRHSGNTDSEVWADKGGRGETSGHERVSMHISGALGKESFRGWVPSDRPLRAEERVASPHTRPWGGFADLPSMEWSPVGRMGLGGEQETRAETVLLKVSP